MPTPRRAGGLFWFQARHAARLGAGAYLAVFDEYDESTAIAKVATDADAVPEGERFLTLDADGVSLPSDCTGSATGPPITPPPPRSPRTGPTAARAPGAK